MNEKERMLSGGFYHPGDEKLVADRLRARSLTMRYNALPPGAWDEHAKILEELLCQMHCIPVETIDDVLNVALLEETDAAN